MNKVWVDGQEIILNDKNWITSGGEADIYKVKNKAFKILKDLKDRSLVERVMFSKKWQGLHIAMPESVIKSKSGDNVGIVMPWLDGNPLLMAFNNNWRADHNVTNLTDAAWTEQIGFLVQKIIDSGARMVDGNEWNYVIRNKSNDVWAIDSDSWCIPGLHATAQMPSIKDWHYPVESIESEWFAAAVVSFQLWTGIHPYKGNIDGFKKGDMAERMRKNVSVLHTGVKVPSVTRDWNDIPKGLLNWYREVFESGSRLPMPQKDKWAYTSVVVLNNIIKNIVSGQLKLFLEAEGLFKGMAYVKDGKYYDLESKVLPWLSTACDKVWESNPGELSVIKLENRNLILNTQYSSSTFENVCSYWLNNGYLWIEYDDVIQILKREDIGNKSYFVQKARWPSTQGLSRNGNVAWANELGGLVVWYVNNDAPVVERLKVLDSVRILKIEQCGNYLVILNKESKSKKSYLSIYDINKNSLVSNVECPEDTFNATSVGRVGLFIVVDDGDVWLWNGSSLTKTDGDVLLSDNLFSYNQKPYIERKSKIFRVSNKT